jgi:hypothetical protein
MTDRYDEMRVPPDPSLAEELRQRLHARMASASRDDHQGRTHLHLDTTRLEPQPHHVPMKEIYVTVDSPTTDSTNRRRMAMAAAAVVAVIGVAGIALAINNTSSDEDEAPSPAVEPTVAPTNVAPTTVAPTTIAPRRETGVFVEGGADNEEVGSVPVSYTVPDGWFNNGWGVLKGFPQAGVIFVNVGNIYTGSCPSVPLDPPVGPTVDDLVSAWANLPGFDATAASDVAVDGFHGKQIEFTIPDYSDEDCQRYLVQEKGSTDPTFPAVANQHQKVWIIDVDGTRLVILAVSFPSTSPQDRAAIDEILASIQIG